MRAAIAPALTHLSTTFAGGTALDAAYLLRDDETDLVELFRNRSQLVNTVVHGDGKLVGHNTDVGGFLEPLEALVRTRLGARIADLIRKQDEVRRPLRRLTLMVSRRAELAEAEQRGFRLIHPQADRPLRTVLDADSMFLGRKLAAEWNLSPGDPVDLQVGTRRVTCLVAGVLQESSGRVSSWDHLAVMDIAAAQIVF